MKPDYQTEGPSKARLERIAKLKEDRKTALTMAERVAIQRSIEYEARMIEREMR